MFLYKYEFVSKRAFNNQLNKLKIELEDNNLVYDGVKALIELGNLSDKYCVDTIWKDNKQAENFVKYEVQPNNPKHKILGW